MELYDQIIKIVDTNIIFCLIPLLSTLLLIEAIFRKRFQTKRVLNFIRWFIIVYTVVTVVHYAFAIAVFPDKSAILQRATGPYKFAFWMMFLSASALPLTVLYKKLGLNGFYLIFIAFLMKSGLYFERFVIIVTSLHRDYMPPNPEISEWISFLISVIMVISLQGFLLAIIMLAIFEAIERGKSVIKGKPNQHSTPNLPHS